jgi:hypothetical protein
LEEEEKRYKQSFFVKVDNIFAICNNIIKSSIYFSSVGVRHYPCRFPGVVLNNIQFYPKRWFGSLLLEEESDLFKRLENMSAESTENELSSTTIVLSKACLLLNFVV